MFFELRKFGFYQSMEDDVICRWRIKDEAFCLDIMPTDKSILGFSNIWYKHATRDAKNFKLRNGHTIKAITSPYFLGTKIEAFKGRDNNDYFASHDLEDVISLLNGRREVYEEVRNSSNQIKAYLKVEFTTFLNEERFMESLPGHLSTSPSQNVKTVTLVMQKIAQL